MIRKLFSLFSLLTLSFANSALAQTPDTLGWDQTQQKIDIVKRGVVFATREELNPMAAWLQLLHQKRHEQKATVGFTADIYWIAFTYKNETGISVEKILEVDNPHIDWLTVYTLDRKGQPQRLVETGDKLLFSSRPMAHRNFAVPLNYDAGETKTILIKIDKRNSSLSFPTYLWSKALFYEKCFTQNLWFGLFFGIIALCLGYALMGFLFLRNTLYGWYFLMVFTSALYVFTSLGFSFQYIYPRILDLNSYFRVYIDLVLVVCVVKFSQAFLGLPEQQIIVNRLLNYLLMVLGLLVLVSFFAMDFLIRHSLLLLSFLDSIHLATFILLIYGASLTFKKQRVTALIYLLAWGTLLIGFMIITASEFGLVPVESFPVNPILIGSSLETFLLSVGLTYQMRKVYNERNQLSLSMAIQQKELLKAYVEGTEKERQRISRELHDDIGSRLGSLKRFLSDDQHNNALLENQIDILCNDVRAMSHQLAPASLGILNFRQLINQLIEETIHQQKLKIDVQFYDIPEILSPSITHHLFRIVQEAISNVLKHANAAELDIQFFGHGNEIVLTLEDNGKGFDPNVRGRGIGLQNINARVESLNGTIEISSIIDGGTNMMIKIPIEEVAQRNP